MAINSDLWTSTLHAAPSQFYSPTSFCSTFSVSVRSVSSERMEELEDFFLSWATDESTAVAIAASATHRNPSLRTDADRQCPPGTYHSSGNRSTIVYAAAPLCGSWLFQELQTPMNILITRCKALVIIILRANECQACYECCNVTTCNHPWVPSHALPVIARLTTECASRRSHGLFTTTRSNENSSHTSPLHGC